MYSPRVCAMATPRPSTSDSLEQEDYSTIESDSVDVKSGSNYSSSTYQQPSAVATLLDHLRQKARLQSKNNREQDGHGLIEVR